MPAVMPSEWASDSTISTGAADTMYVLRPAWRWRSSRRRASGRILASSFGQHLGVQRHQVVLAHAGDGAEDAVAHGVGRAVAGRRGA